MPVHDPSSGWTVETLLSLMDERDLRYRQRFEAQEKALTEARTSLETRLDSMNEFRGALRDQATAMLPRTEYAVGHAQVIDMVNVDRSRLDKLEGRAGGLREWGGWALALLAVAWQIFKTH